MTTYKKDPDATLDYEFDWAAWLDVVGDSIASVEFVLSSGLTLVSQSNTASTATAYVSGGEDGEEETLTCRITTSSTPPRVDDRSVTLWIVER